MNAIHILAAVCGFILIGVYFRSIIIVSMLNSKSNDFIEQNARRCAVFVIHLFIRKGASYEDVQKRQAWIMPLFVLFCVVSWFILVQIAFAGILWGFRIEVGVWRALSSSGSALSTLGYLTPESLSGQYLAVFQAAIGLVLVILLFTFVPGYQAAVQTRERRVGWLYARAAHEANSQRYLDWLLTSKRDGDIRDGWEDWENWFRGIRETHTLSPILAYVPSIYTGTSWLAASSAVLDAATAVTACLGDNAPTEISLCQREGTVTMQLVTAALGVGNPDSPAAAAAATSTHVVLRFDGLYEMLVAGGFTIVGTRDECHARYVALRGHYAPQIRQIAATTLTPMVRLDVADRDHRAAGSASTSPATPTATN
jgi:hypothetical protein